MAINPANLPEGFKAFWMAYPRKVGKGQAVKAWMKNNCEPIADEIVTAVKKYPFSDEIIYIPHASTFLNGWRWLDEFSDGGGGDEW